MELIRYHIVFRGHVQHCGFRYFTWKKVKKVGNLTGWVRNKADGSVEMEVQGREEDIKDVLVLIKKGNGTIRVDEVQVEEINVIPEEKLYQVLR
ncbi:MAG: acylphosphatase [Eubacteriales bacterium]|nr:acylphosphatase [Eubacteriales bacterium]